MLFWHVHTTSSPHYFVRQMLLVIQATSVRMKIKVLMEICPLGNHFYPRWINQFLKVGFH